MNQIEVMKQALEALKETHYVLINANLLDQSRLNKNFTAAEALRQAIEQAGKVEPVAWAAQNTRTQKFHYIWHEEADVLGWIQLQHQSRDDVTFRGPVPLYTHPPAAPAQQPLTLNQIDAIENKVYMATTNKSKPKYEYALALVRAVEQAHGIKGVSL